MAKTQVLPAAERRQTELAEVVAATEAADVDAGEARNSLVDFVDRVNTLRKAITKLEAATDYENHDIEKHAQQVRDHVRPAMAELREVVDDLETRIPKEMWPLPTYREMLSIK